MQEVAAANQPLGREIARGEQRALLQRFGKFLKAVDEHLPLHGPSFDAERTELDGTGNVNLRNEALNVRLTAHSKTFSLASLRGPIDVTGTLKQPIVSPEIGTLIARGGLAVAIGSVTAGIGALIPLIELGKKDETHCRELKAEAKADVGVKERDLAMRKKRR